MNAPVIATTHELSVKGKRRPVAAFRVDDAVVVTRGVFLRIAEIFDEYWLEADALPDYRHVIERLAEVSPRPDVFTFAQRVPDTKPRYGFHMDWDNVAVIPVSSHAHWLRDQIAPASRRNVRAAEKKGVVVRVADYDDAYVRGVMSIYNESPFRHGRRYWHYNKDFATVQAENGTYAERSTFLGAYVMDEMVGYMKIVWDTRTAAIMQIVSKMASFDRRPNNALLSEAVRLCAERKVDYLQYEAFVYGNKVDSSLTRFKRANGFVRMDVPRYYVPLTRRGTLCLRLGLHKSLKDRIPERLANRLLAARDAFYARRARQA
jgi:hypothetical protein